MLKQIPLFVLLILCPFAEAQVGFGNTQGLLGSTGVGQRSGQDVDLRVYATGMYIRDTGLTPYSVTPEGKLLQVGALSGAEMTLGAYGRHTFRKSAIGLDYMGNARHYPSAPNYDGINQQLNLRYAIEASRKLSFSFATF